MKVLPHRAQRRLNMRLQCSPKITKDLGVMSYKYRTKDTSRKRLKWPVVYKLVATIWTAVVYPHPDGLACWWRKSFIPIPMNTQQRRPVRQLRPYKTSKLINSTCRSVPAFRQRMERMLRATASYRIVMVTMKLVASKCVCITIGSWYPVRVNAGDLITLHDMSVESRETLAVICKKCYFLVYFSQIH